jgi:cytochrome c peroxidase
MRAGHKAAFAGCLITLSVAVLSLHRAFSAPPGDALAAWRTPPTQTGSTAAGPSAEERRRIALGALLFFDPILSGNATQSCATCHNPSLSWAAGVPRAIGNASNIMGFRSPTLLDISGLPLLGWNGKFPSIESVTFAAVASHQNMNLPVGEALARLGRLPGYVAAFGQAFPGQGITRATVEAAVAGYERTIVSTQAPFDRWVRGDAHAISPAARRGFALFSGAARCAECHSGWAFTDGSFHDIGTATGDAIGRGALFPTSIKLRYAFKTPTLRDVARRAPYMHDGSVPTLQAVIDLYDRGGIDRPSRSELIQPLHLSPGDKADILAFLGTLTGDPTPVAVPILPR